MHQIETEEIVDIEKQDAIVNIVSLIGTFDISLDEIYEMCKNASEYTIRESKLFTKDGGKF